MNKKDEEAAKKAADKLMNLKTEKVIGCKNCHRTRCTLIKASDSYYCKECFYSLKKEHFKKAKNGKV